MQITITDFVSAFESIDSTGRHLNVASRHTDGIIITLSGKIIFSYNGKEVVSSPGHPVFIPKGARYLNSCIEDAYSYNINFYSETNIKEIIQLPKIADEVSKKHFDILSDLSIKLLSDNNTAIRFFAVSQLYALLGDFFKNNTKRSTSRQLFDNAVKIICKRFNDSSFLCSDIAKELFISEAYLRKIFKKYSAITPWQYITKIRMEQARFLLLYQNSIKSVALQCGYSDVYGFSKAYSKYYGYPPGKT